MYESESKWYIRASTGLGELMHEDKHFYAINV
jgi:hypothetical protein